MNEKAHICDWFGYLEMFDSVEEKVFHTRISHELDVYICPRGSA